MRIACLGWGSLVWRPGDLPVQKIWFKDGPLLPIEFARHSEGDRITLVITPDALPVRALWAPMTVPDLNTATFALARRENIPNKNIGRYIGRWTRTDDNSDPWAETVGRWAPRVMLDAVVWTGLPPKFEENEGRVPTADEVISFLRSLPPQASEAAEMYVRMAPRQIDTRYRRLIERELNWTPLAP